MICRQAVLLGQHLTRSFGQGETATLVLRDVSVDLFAGGMCLVMGPSGSGKSTLLALLSGLLRPDAGQVLIQNEDLWALPERARKDFRRRECGFIFQGFNLFPALTARQQLEVVLRWGEGVPGREAQRRAAEMLALLGLEKKAHLRPGQLSGGEKQRVSVGRALIKEPTFCFADEPTSALDWENGKRVIELLQAAARQRGAALFVVSHDTRIIPYADQVLHLEDGCLKERNPATSLVAEEVP